MNKALLIKYLKNNCSDDEFEEFVMWVKNDLQNKEGKQWSFDHWKTLEPDLNKKDEEKLSALLDRIHHEINLSSRKSRNNKLIDISTVSKWVSRVAAVLFIPLLGVVFYLLPNSYFQSEKFTNVTVDSLEVIAPIGSRTVVQLSDGTEITLNYGSKIKYPQRFTGKKREIKLTGEAYFNVAHNPDKPFVVNTGKLNVTALGTEFNVHSYADNDVISTTLVEGIVLIDKILPGEKTERIGRMVPGQHVSYNLNSDEIKSTRGNIEKYIAWRDGKLVFDNTPISIVTKELSRNFNVDIEVADDVKYLTYTVTFANDPLFLILDLMTETTPIRYKRYPREKLDDGTFSKQKIRIEKRK